MFPALSASQQELILMLCQKQLQNNLGQANPLAQIMKATMQLNALKLLAQESSAASMNGENPQAQLLAALQYINQENNAMAQLSKLMPSQTIDLATPSKSGMLSMMDADPSGSSDNSRVQSLSREKTSSKKESRNNAKSANIPALSYTKNQASAFEAQDLEGKDADGVNSKSKKIISKKMNDCGHPERPHYAKNMCNQCYHKFGRTKKPWKCNHEKLYAHGLCQNCYINAYNKKRSGKGNENVSSTGSNSAVHEIENEIPISSISTTEPLTVEDKIAFGDIDEQEIAELKERLEKLERGDKIELLEKLELPAKLENTETMTNVETVEKVESMKNEDIDIEGVNNVEKIENEEESMKNDDDPETKDIVDNVEKVAEVMEDVENVKNTEVDEVKNVENTEKVDEVKNIENTEGVEEVERVEEVKQVERMEIMDEAPENKNESEEPKA